MKEMDKLEDTRQELHYKMDNSQRAKQFAPFDALKGFKEELKKKEKGNPEYNGQIPVSVIASFSTLGETIPVYFGLNGNRYHIDNIVWSAKGKWGAKYRCEITDGEYVKTIDLIYYITDNEWKIKM